MSLDNITAISLGRIAIGAFCLASPDAAAKAFQLDPENNPQLQVINRMFGAREVALGTTTLLARGTARRNLAVAGLAVDAADGAAAVTALRDRVIGAPAALLIGLAAAGAVGAGVTGIRGTTQG